METQYDLIVIGAGPGGYVAAVRAAQYGLKTAVIERHDIGGTCLNRGCMPTKIYMHAAHVYADMKSCEAFGVYAEHVRYDLEAMKTRKDVVLAQLRGGIERLLAARKIDCIRGEARILAAGRVAVGGAVYTADKILIAVGSRPARLPIPGLEISGVLTSDEVLAGALPDWRRITIIGGGVVGAEFASLYNALGREVTILEAMDRILPGMDKEIAQNLAMIFKKRGIEIFTGVQVEAVRSENEGLVCSFAAKGALQAVSSDGVLVSVGRGANTDGLLADGLELNMERGRIPVDARFETVVPGIYAIGDVVLGAVQLAHMASAQGLCAVAAMCGKACPVDLSVVPSCIYTSPEIASVGMSLDAAKAAGISVKSGKFVMSANGKTLIEGGTRGFIKVIFDAETDVILGAQLMCARATDMVGELAAAIVNRLTRRQLAAVIRPHPTFAEGIAEAVEDVEGLAIHTVRKA